MLSNKNCINAKKEGGQYAPFFLRAQDPKENIYEIISLFYLQWGSASTGMSCKILPLFAFWRGGQLSPEYSA